MHQRCSKRCVSFLECLEIDNFILSCIHKFTVTLAGITFTSDIQYNGKQDYRACAAVLTFFILLVIICCKPVLNCSLFVWAGNNIGWTNGMITNGEYI